ELDASHVSPSNHPRRTPKAGPVPSSRRPESHRPSYCKVLTRHRGDAHRSAWRSLIKTMDEVSIIRAVRMSGRPIALDLSKPGFDAPFDARPMLVGIVEDLVSLLETQMPAEADFPAEPLRSRLRQRRMRLRTSETAEALHDAGLRLVGDASQ